MGSWEQQPAGGDEPERADSVAPYPSSPEAQRSPNRDPFLTPVPKKRGSLADINVDYTIDACERTPLRGPLVQRANALRRQALSRLSEDQFNFAVKVLNEHDDDASTETLVGELGSDLYEELIGVLVEVVACEEAIANLNAISGSMHLPNE